MKQKGGRLCIVVVRSANKTDETNNSHQTLNLCSGLCENKINTTTRTKRDCTPLPVLFAERTTTLNLALCSPQIEGKGRIRRTPTRLGIGRLGTDLITGRAGSVHGLHNVAHDFQHTVDFGIGADGDP